MDDVRLFLGGRWTVFVANDKILAFQQKLESWKNEAIIMTLTTS